jgi:hypothetical protein
MQKLAARFREIHGKARPIIAVCLFWLLAILASVGFQL